MAYTFTFKMTNNQLTIQKAWHAKGFSFDVWHDPPGQVWEDFVHAVDELFMLVEGSVEMTMQGKIFRLDINEEILILAGVKHSVRNVGDTINCWYYGYKK